MRKFLGNDSITDRVFVIEISIRVLVISTITILIRADSISLNATT